MAQHRCHCPCHRESTITPFHGVDVLDPIETVTACAGCINHHCVALIERKIWDAPTVPRVVTPWVDPNYPPERPDTGEGPE